jgi:hypothetical protein
MFQLLAARCGKLSFRILLKFSAGLPHPSHAILAILHRGGSVTLAPENLEVAASPTRQIIGQ